MRFDLITIFPQFFSGFLDHGIVRRARETGLTEVAIHDLREFTRDRHRTVDDRPFGGGEGMVLKPEPIFEAVDSLLGASTRPEGTSIILLSASGKLFHQDLARRFSKQQRLILLCGRYEGVDERVAEHLATDEISIGDFVLSGGEVPAAVIVDAVTRLLPGALGNEDSTVNESFSVLSPITGGGPEMRPSVTMLTEAKPVAETNERRATIPAILDYPHYTRPQIFRGWEVPEILIGGNHEQIRRWRNERAIAKTRRNRPDLIR